MLQYNSLPRVIDYLLHFKQNAAYYILLVTIIFLK